MSTRQKSFFDQNQKPKGQWNRPRPPTFAYPNSNPAPVQPAHHVVSGPPIVPSSQTRKKLKSFQFLQDTPADQPGKENAAVATSTESAPKSPTLAEQAPTMGLKPAETPKAAHSKPCPPSTPATRLPLADLVGNVDDSRRYAQQTIVSPDEQLAWRGSQPVSTPFIQRKRKRARSSSPVGPSQDDETELAIEAQTRTPLPDPAKELWSRYTSNKGTPNAHKAVAFAHLINDPSPRSSSTAGSVSGLRRWASCGTEFPASTKKKKRKTFGVFKATKDANEDVFAIASSDGAFPGPQEESKLAGMVQLMRESLRNAPSDLPSSSSPLPDISERFAGPAESPLQNRGHRNGSSQTSNHDMGVMDEEVTRATSRTSHSSSDEFGDADFDYDTVNTLKMSQSGAQQVENEAAPPVAPVSPAAVATISDANQQPTIGTGSDDEFGLDEDDFVADLEQVASLYDCRAVESSMEHHAEPSLAASHTSAATHAGAQPPLVDLVDEDDDDDDDDDDDEFGDDIDVDDFAAAEVAASQAPAMTSTGR
ncbi:hypothetical protein BS50DRAFT_223503 [Corynespora cassiicola Philippines]|uniref:Uncharacterized protein n=1 Tax=Corynespora cassiicola Philippines TaxID=1448308 RepID=A0A2T2N2V5_CORCC|nr:hypothetical protein BS50DRAFT_223503 [Corynespora cassiicola Philippines]